MKQDILQRMLLPMGDITKNEARSYAAERGFGQVAAKKDSIGVCFCPLDYRSFLKREVLKHYYPVKVDSSMKRGISWDGMRAIRFIP